MIEIEENLLDSLELFINYKETLSNEVEIAWLGQAGFLIKYINMLFIIDPYLSDYLSKKYKGKLFPHKRLMDIPLNPKSISNLNVILISHAHSDHMDPETLSILSNNNDNSKIIVPAAEIEEAINRGAKRDQIIPCNDGELIELNPSLSILGVGASHETIEINELGEFRFLGYIIDLGGIRIYHSGDCIPYEGLNDKLKQLNIDIALLPINGRDDYRFNNGITGNFKITEVLELCGETGIKNLIVHHFGMFENNTVSKEELEKLAQMRTSNLQIIIPEINQIYKIKKL